MLDRQSYYVNLDKGSNRWVVNCLIERDDRTVVAIVGTYNTRRGAKWVAGRQTKLLGRDSRPVEVR